MAGCTTRRLIVPDLGLDLSAQRHPRQLRLLPTRRADLVHAWDLDHTSLFFADHVALGKQFLTTCPKYRSAKNPSGGLLDVDGLRLHRPLSDLAVRLTAKILGRISITPPALRPSENLISAAMAPSIMRSSLRSRPIVTLSKLVLLLPHPFFRLASDDAFVFLASADMSFPLKS
jgi:hypothetical protein